MSAPSPRFVLVAAVLTLGATVLVPAPASAAEAVPNEVVVSYEGTAAGAAAATGGRPYVVKRVRDVGKALRALRRSGRVRYAVPNLKARAAAPFVPNDPGRTGPGGWQQIQWNFAGPWSVNAPDAWGNLIAARRPGGRGVTVAVLDTGVAYAFRKPHRRSPDLNRGKFVAGYDFVDGDQYPNDVNGHGTHVASTIAEATDNGVALTGLAYGATIMPVRVLDNDGEGSTSDIADGIRFAARKGARIINLSLEFSADVTASAVPQLIDAIGYAHRRGVFVVGAAGNEGLGAVDYPARAKHVIAVGATTEHGCISDFSNQGRGLDLVAPGGGRDAPLGGDPNCRPTARVGRNIYQLTLIAPRRRRFGLPGGYEGTSMAAPHVSATAALVIASGVLGPRPSPRAVELRLKFTARDLGPPGRDAAYGAGLIDAAAATSPAIPPPPPL
jgi:serine protease